jgi:tryptophan synthase beta chain
MLAQCEGIIPALESSHAVAGLPKIVDRVPEGGLVIINVSGRGDKDMATIAKRFAVEGTP